MKISFITPSYNNLEYLKLCHQSLLDNIINIEWEHCIADDGSFDETLQWLNLTSLTDRTIKFIRKEKRIGHTELYNELVEKVSTGNIIMILHADMFLISKNTIPNLLKYLKEKTVICSTRLEPEGMYPPSEEKILTDFGGLTIKELKINKLKNEVKELEIKNKDKTIKSIFAPWICYKKDYLPMDLLYNPFPHEDFCVFQRFILNEYNIIQSLDAIIPHFCSKGHRKTDENNPTQDNSDYAYYENKARRNYLRKWQSWMKFSQYQYPAIPKIYNVGFIVKNCFQNLLYTLEPWCRSIYIESEDLIKKYKTREQSETLFDLSKKIKSINEEKVNDILIEMDANKINQNNIQIITQLSEIISNTNEIGIFEYDIFKFEIKSLNTYEKNLASLNNPYYTSQLLINK